MTMVLVCMFWATLGLIGFTYAGYPLLLALLLTRRRSRACMPGPKVAVPRLVASVVLVARNEAGRIAARLANLLATDSPALREVIVVCDGCTDETAALAEAFPDPRVQALRLEPGLGKPAGINAGMAAAAGEVVVLCDARQRFLPDTLTQLLAGFTDPMTGAVSGALEIEPSVCGPGQGVDAYWKLEKLIRRLESDLDSSVGCTGAVYAVRRAAFESIPEDTVLDDVVIPMQIAARGLRVRFCPEARAYDPQPLTGESEERRKVRTLGGNFQMLFRYPQWLLPHRHRLWWKLIAHKYLRLAGPVLLALLLTFSWLLSVYPIYLTAFVAQAGLYAAALLGWWRPRVKIRLFTMAAGFLFLQVCIVRGFFWWLGTKNGSRAGWK